MCILDPVLLLLTTWAWERSDHSYGSRGNCSSSVTGVPWRRVACSSRWLNYKSGSSKRKRKIPYSHIYRKAPRGIRGQDSGCFVPNQSTSVLIIYIDWYSKTVCGRKCSLMKENLLPTMGFAVLDRSPSVPCFQEISWYHGGLPVPAPSPELGKQDVLWYWRLCDLSSEYLKPRRFPEPGRSENKCVRTPREVPFHGIKRELWRLSDQRGQTFTPLRNLSPVATSACLGTDYLIVTKISPAVI